MMSPGVARVGGDGSVDGSRVRNVRGGRSVVRTLAAATVALGLVAAGCSRDERSALVEQRPYEVHVPPGSSSDDPMPLLVVLHGYGLQAKVQSLYFGLDRVTDPRGIMYVAPQGTSNDRGMPFWNATDACCAPPDSTVDDSSYLRDVVEDVRRNHAVDERRIFVLGHSNGGFMAYRLACDHADLFAGVVSLEGAMWAEERRCDPSEPVSVLAVHGTADNVIAYDGGVNNAANPDAPPYPSATESVAAWASFDDCDPQPAPGDPQQRQLLVAKPPATVSRFTGCADGAAVELWTQPDGDHVPKLDESFTEQVVDFLLAHPKPA